MVGVFGIALCVLGCRNKVMHDKIYDGLETRVPCLNKLIEHLVSKGMVSIMSNLLI